MKLISNTPLLVTAFNIDGFLAISERQMESGGEQLFLQKNQVEFGNQWQIALDFSIAIVTIIALYEPQSKLDFSKLASYRATQNYTFEDISGLDNENEELDKLAIKFHKEFSEEYNKRLIGTKVQIPFPTEVAKQLVQFREHVILNLYKSIETVRNYQKS